jgi:hypothetical protein
MLARGAAAVLAGALAFCLSAAAAEPEPAKPVESFRLGNEPPDGTVVGWVNGDHSFGQAGHAFLSLKMMKIDFRAGYSHTDMVWEKLRTGGNYFHLDAHWVPDPSGRKPLDADSAALARLHPLDLVEVEWADKGLDHQPVTIKLIRSVPVSGVITGKFHMRIGYSIFIEVTKAPPGAEHLVGHEVYLQCAYVFNPDRKSPDSIIPAPHIAKMLAPVSAGDMVDVNYKIDTILRLVSIAKSSAPPPAAGPVTASKPEPRPGDKPAPADKPPAPPDKPPKPPPPPAPKPGDAEDF